MSINGFARIILLPMILLISTANAYAERVFLTGYKDGFYIKSEQEGGMEIRLGGAFQADYRHYLEDEREDNGFDIRRARLVFRGQLTQWFRFGLEYEFQGNETKHLVDAYGELVFQGSHAVRMGQFKEPFSLEWQTRDKGLYFAERSNGYSLTPKRDIGVMAHGSFFQDALNYGIGLFNGDGVDGSGEGDSDAPEITGRLVYQPFRHTAFSWLQSLQFGASGSYAEIDLANVNLDVKSTGMAGTDRNLYVLKSNTKFGVLQDVGSRMRLGAEAAWTWGPLAVYGEYMSLSFNDLKPSGEPERDADFFSIYGSVVYCITGESIVLTGGGFKPLFPDRFFNPAEGTFGALIAAVRMEHFEGDEDWIKTDAFVSTKEANAYSIALNWILFPMHRMVFDYTHTKFDDPIRVRVNPDGGIDYVDEENVFTLRLSMDF